ncbi:propanediol utilization protein, partial [Thioclava sp. BHET1]
MTKAPAEGRATGHFGELLQGRLGPDGPLALVTLPCPPLAARVTRDPGAFALHQPAARALPP